MFVGEGLVERMFLYEFIIGKNIFNFVSTSVEILYVELFPEFGCFLVENAIS